MTSPAFSLHPSRPDGVSSFLTSGLSRHTAEADDVGPINICLILLEPVLQF